MKFNEPFVDVCNITFLIFTADGFLQVKPILKPVATIALIKFRAFEPHRKILIPIYVVIPLFFAQLPNFLNDGKAIGNGQQKKPSSQQIFEGVHEKSINIFPLIKHIVDAQLAGDYIVEGVL